MGTDKTAFGIWVDGQGRGALTRAQLATGLAYTTVLAARTRLVTHEVAVLLSKHTRGAVKVAQMAKPRNRAA